jgi:Flp pilus assembly protein TadB
VNATLALSTLCLVAGGLLIASSLWSPRRPALATRLDWRRGAGDSVVSSAATGLRPVDAAWIDAARFGYERLLRMSGGGKTLARLLAEKASFAGAVPLVVLMLYAAAMGRLPSLSILLVAAAAGFFVPDLALRAEVKRRREAIFLDLPEAVSVMGLGLGAGQSLRQAVELAARDCQGPLADELARGLSLARRERRTDEREALVRVARESSEQSFARFAELLAAKESPYLDFLRDQARQMRGEQSRYLERAADRAYLAMHVPLAPLLAVMVLLVAYGFLHVLGQTI